MTTSQGISTPPFARPLLEGSRLAGRAWAFLSSRWAAGKAGGERLLVLEDRLVIGPKKSLTLVQCAGRRYLVAVSGDTIASLLEVATKEVAADLPARQSRPRARKDGGR